MEFDYYFTKVVEDNYQALYRFAISLTRSESDASDLTQEAFQTFALKGNQLRDRSKAKFWLFRTLHRAFLLRSRRESRFSSDAWEDLSEALPADTPMPADRIDSAMVVGALQQVTEPFRAPVALFYLHDWTYAEIAQVLEIPLGTVKSRISRGIVELRNALTLSSGLSPTGTLVAPF